MIRRVVLLLVGFGFLAACSPAPAAPTTTPSPLSIAVRPTIIPSPTQLSCSRPGTVQSLRLAPLRDIGLYLPPCYESNLSSNYPVLYLLPGFGGTSKDWFDTGLAPLTDALIQSGEIPPFIIVTTDNTYEVVKPEEIITVLLPYIDSHYRTLSDRVHRAIAGGSLGGASAYMLTFQHPDLFASAGVFGNGLVMGLDGQVDAWLEAIPLNLKPRIFLNSGEQDTWMIQQAKALIPYLDKYGIEHAEVFSSGGHSGSYWLSNFPAYYTWLQEDWE